ncbi:MAG: ribosome silencing factor [Bacteroidia bacterium]|nr:ribosome silencing factor [Bacteroidia bacterium]
MKKRKTNSNPADLLAAIITGIHKKKGLDIISIDFSGLKETVCDYFVICHGDSSTHVNAIAESVDENVKTEMKEKPWSKEGFENSQWILLDYANIVVHIFQKPYRGFYNLENLWADGITTAHPDTIS